MNRLLISLLFIFLASGISAQKSIDGFMELFGWVEKLDDNISMIVKKENKRKLVRKIGYLQSDLGDFMNDKKEITEHLINHCTNSSNSILDIEKEIDDYNIKIESITERLNQILEIITFEEELYSVTEKKIITVYREPISTGNSLDSFPERRMIQQSVINQRLDGKVAKDTLVDVTVERNRVDWKEVDFEELLFEIENSLQAKGANMEFVINELSMGCDLELINQESKMAIEVLSNIRDEFRDLREKIKDFIPQ